MITHTYIACLLYKVDDSLVFSKCRINGAVMARYLIFALAYDAGLPAKYIVEQWLQRGRCMRYHFERTVADLKSHNKDFILKLHLANKIIQMTQQ